MKSRQFENCAQRLKALADPHRLHIVTLLRKGALNASEIAAAMDKEVATVSHHLAILRQQQVVRATRQGRFMLYALALDTTETESGGLEVNFGCCLVNINDTHLSILFLQDGS